MPASRRRKPGLDKAAGRSLAVACPGGKSAADESHFHLFEPLAEGVGDTRQHSMSSSTQEEVISGAFLCLRTIHCT